jgi:hypothetical protein
MSSSNNINPDEDLSQPPSKDDIRSENYIRNKTEQTINTFQNPNISKMKTSLSSSSSSSQTNLINNNDRIDKIKNVNQKEKVLMRFYKSLMNKQIRDEILHKLDWKSIVYLSRTNNFVNKMVNQYIEEYHISNFHKYEDIKQFLYGCKIWGYLIAVDSSSVIYHAISKLGIKSFAVFYTHGFIVLPLKYAEDAIGICWLYSNALTRYDRGRRFKQSRVYEAFKMLEVSRQRNNKYDRIMLDENQWNNYIDNKDRGQKWIKTESPREWISAHGNLKFIEQADLAFKTKVLGIFDQDKLIEKDPIYQYIKQRQEIAEQLSSGKIKIPLYCTERTQISSSSSQQQQQHQQIQHGGSCVIT